MSASTWTIAAAKESSNWRARAGRRPSHAMGAPLLVIVAADEWERKTRRTGNLAEFFADSPLRASGLKVRRRKDRARKIDL
jgi:hypothetical protein